MSNKNKAITLAPCDFLVNNQGSIFIVIPVSDAGREWMDEHLPEDAQRWGSNGVVVEHRYIQDIVDGMQAEGLIGKGI